MLLACFCTVLFFRAAIAQPSTELSARELDSLLQDYAFRAFARPRTGIVYDGDVPANLTGVRVAALRLRSGSLRRRGVPSYKEFRIPAGVLELPYVKRLVLVYHDLGNWSDLYYPLPGYRFLAPVLGILAYDASDLSATNLSELDIRASGEPVSVNFAGVLAGTGRHGEPGAKCVRFGLDGSVGFDNVVNGSACLTTSQGHFSIVVESAAAPAPAPGIGGRSGGGKGNRTREWVVAGSVVGGAALVAVLVVVFACVRRSIRRRKIRRMEDAAEVGVVLPMTSVGNTRAPVALGTRTRPSLENEFVP